MLVRVGWSQAIGIAAILAVFFLVEFAAQGFDPPVHRLYQARTSGQ
jgi:hypothetical protein